MVLILAVQLIMSGFQITLTLDPEQFYNYCSVVRQEENVF